MNAQLTHEQITFTFPLRWFEFPKLISLSDLLQSLYSRFLCVISEYVMFVDIYLIGQIHGAQNLQLKKTSQKTYVSKDRSRRENAKNRKKDSLFKFSAK